MKYKKIYNMNKEKQANTISQVNNSIFNEFLEVHREKIHTIVPKNPCISKKDEWRNED